MEINDDILDYLTRGPVFVIATRDDRLQPSVTEGMGIIRADSRRELHVAFSSVLSPETLTNLTANQQIAVSLCTPANYRAIQIKGVCTEVRSVRKEDQPEIDAWLELKQRAIWMEGTQLEVAMALDRNVTHVARVVVSHIYDQTPGRNAGGAIA